jgi:hypothetical protein
LKIRQECQDKSIGIILTENGRIKGLDNKKYPASDGGILFFFTIFAAGN